MKNVDLDFPKYLTEQYYRLFRNGSRFSCPFCLHSYNAFMPAGYKQKVLTERKVVGGGFRQNVLCPYCRSSDRERLVYMFIKKNHLVRKQMKVLHVAPEKNLFENLRKEELNLYSADIKNSIARIKMDIRKIDFPNEYFDAIICNHVLEHIVDDQKAMKELYRVLKSSGWAILQVPYSNRKETFEDPTVKTESERTATFGQPDHVRIYGKDFVSRLRIIGFNVEEKKMDENTSKKFALNSNELIFFCKKSGFVEIEKNFANKSPVKW